MSVCVCRSCDNNCAPSPVRQGERAEWTWILCDYPADEFDLQIRFRGPGTGFDVDATADGTAFDMEQIFDAALAVGKWAWQAWITEIATPTNTFVIKSGFITVEAGFAAAGTATVETRSAAEIALATIDAALLAFATGDVLEYEIATPAGSRKVKRSDKSELRLLRKDYATIVSLERTKRRIQNGGSLMRSVGITVREC